MATSRAVSLDDTIARLTTVLFHEHQQYICKRTDRFFAGLLLFQWLAGIAVALWISPATWAETYSQTYLHVWAALLFGGVTISFPLILVLTRPGAVLTRHTIAAAQMLLSALLIHLTGGRIETHFHVFGSLAFLAFYRDWRVLISASSVVILDHLLRGVYWPQSIFGVLTVNPWRWLEHGGWVIFADIFLIVSCTQGVREMRHIAGRRAQLEATNETVEAAVVEWTAKLIEGEERYRSLTMATAQIVWMTGAEGGIGEDLPLWRAFTGQSAEEMKGWGWLNAVHPEDRQHMQESWSQAVATGTLYTTEYRLRRHDGEYRSIAARGVPILDREGSIREWVGVCEDITGRRQAEEALQHSEQKYRTLVHQIHDGVFLIQDGKVVFANEALATMIGYTMEELIGVDFPTVIAPEDVRMVIDRHCRRLAGEDLPREYEFRLLHKDQVTRVAVELNVALITYESRGATLGTLRDITARKQVEAERQHLQAQLLQAQKLEAVGTLAGGMAHDFNNLLSVVVGFTELATDDIPEGSRARRNLEEVLKASRRARALVQQLLTFSRPRAQKHSLILLYPIVEETLTFLRASLPKNITLCSHIERTARVVWADPTQMQQVVLNLCLNAVQAMEEHGGGLEVSLQEVKTDGVSTQASHPLKLSPHLRLTVRDTGCGIAPEVQARIFEPFFTTKSVGKGSGLGLSVVHGIMTSHGGAITVESEPDRGATFQVYLPVNERVVSPEELLDVPVSLGPDCVSLVNDVENRAARKEI